MWGRNVYDSIRKFLQFQLTVNIVAVSLAFIGAVTDEKGESPLKPVQLLWVNLIMDTMAALALATDPPTPDLLKRPPYGKNDQLITRRMWLNILGQAAFQLIVNLIVLYCPDLFHVVPHSTEHRTLIFNVFVMCQLFNELNCRKLDKSLNIFAGLLTNRMCLGIFIFTMVMQFAMVELGGEWTSTVPLSINQWLLCIAIGSISILVSLVLRFVDVKEYIAPPVKREAPSLSRDKSAILWGKLKKATTAHGVVQFLQNPKKSTLTSVLRRSRNPGVRGF
jgi:magnesium-transporting ATPase (P-type)